ncbi:hypothetical protein J2S55_009482 [Streptosporangium brasiliense]|uniref:Uncharacterized protein n=1 Tax=Streptosporangium brasiliense TaxID=47480 RepID=A0ABT9RN15_9ACTN|nr:hypothetical protein [Streptosporangium brasiliense]
MATGALPLESTHLRFEQRTRPSRRPTRKENMRQ